LANELINTICLNSQDHFFFGLTKFKHLQAFSSLSIENRIFKLVVKQCFHNNRVYIQFIFHFFFTPYLPKSLGGSASNTTT